ncbi:MAG: hypothetical protein MUE46_13730 [Xanthomonadales bacterium]|nr:hypothetical protein [Xanthomonadales bacterium]
MSPHTARLPGLDRVRQPLDPISIIGERTAHLEHFIKGYGGVGPGAGVAPLA